MERAESGESAAVYERAVAGEGTVMKERSFSIELPYSPYRVAVAVSPRATEDVSLAKNSQLRMGTRHQVLIRKAKRQMAEDVTKLMHLATWPKMRTPLTLSAAIHTRTSVSKDDDGAWTALYPARDAIAAMLGINDSEIRTGAVTFEKGEPERTVLTVEGNEA